MERVPLGGSGVQVSEVILLMSRANVTAPVVGPRRLEHLALIDTTVLRCFAQPPAANPVSLSPAVIWYVDSDSRSGDGSASRLDTRSPTDIS
jgi:hypothetical protein